MLKYNYVVIMLLLKNMSSNLLYFTNAKVDILVHLFSRIIIVMIIIIIAITIM